MVQVTKRFYLEILWTRFQDVELRIRMEDESDSGRVQLSKNPLCGVYKEASSEAVASFILTSPVSGKFLTLQNLLPLSVDVNEIDIFL